MSKTKDPGELRRRALMMELVRESGISDPNALYEMLRDMFASTMEDMLKTELDAHLGYEKHDQSEKPNSNRRNGNTPKNVMTNTGKHELRIPRDRDGSFEPQLVKKGENDVSEIEQKVMSMYAKGMSDRDISAIIEDIYGFSISHETVSKMVERIQPRFIAWQSRTLESCYAFLYIDALMVSAKSNGKAVKKAVYTAVGIDMTGHKDILGLWISENEGSHFWMMIFDELKVRGVERLLFVCIDGLKGLEEGIHAIYPKAHVQRCMVHLVRNSVKYIPTKHYKAFCRDARAIYAEASFAESSEALTALTEHWGVDYPSAVRVWSENFEQIERLFTLPSAIRKMIYTTNMIEGVNSSLRKVTRGKAAFPNDASVLNALFLRVLDITKKWTMPVANWPLVLGQIDVMRQDMLW